MKHWIACSPTDRIALSSMRYILNTCQHVKEYTASRIDMGDRKGNVKPIEELIDLWLQDYLHHWRMAEDASRYAMKDAMREILVRGIKTPAQKRLDWQGFSVEPRGGWRKARREEATTSWEDYQSGKHTIIVREGDKRTVLPDAATTELLTKGLVYFKWGVVQLKGEYIDRIGVQAAAKGIGKEDFLRKVVQVDFVRTSTENHREWKTNFVLE